MNQSVIQFGGVFGSEIDEVAMAVGAYGQYDIIDINPSEVKRLTDKYWKVYQGVKIFKQDASQIKAEVIRIVLTTLFLLQPKIAKIIRGIMMRIT